jgi:sulfur transfer protein SufE
VLLSAEELADTAASAATLQQNASQVPELTDQLADTERKYHKLLEMYGALQEVAEERRLDLLDIKEVYKHQIDHLVSQLHRLGQSP